MHICVCVCVFSDIITYTQVSLIITLRQIVYPLGD